MQISITASGTPQNVTNDIATQIKQARAKHPDASPAIASLKDYVDAEVRKPDPTDTVSVSASITVTVTATPAVERRGSALRDAEVKEPTA